jgi:hypothetical protein
MAKQKGSKNQIVTTPKGTANYPWLNEADTKFGDATYKVDVITDAGDAAELIKRIDDAIEANLAYWKENAEADVVEVYADEPPYFEDGEGVICFRCKLNKDGKNKKTGETWINKIAFFDAARKAIPASSLPKIGNGSIVRVSSEMRPWAMPVVEGRGRAQKKSLRVGVKLSIKAVQVIEARQGGGNVSADDMGFEEEEGFAYDQYPVDDNDVPNSTEGNESRQGGADDGFDNLDF